MSDVPPPPAQLPPQSSWVRIESFQYTGTDPAADRIGPDQYLNPILAGFYPDPSICRVGEDYYLINSTFAWYPGVPIFHSRDLVHWTQIGHVLDRPSQLKLDGLGVSDGIYAPAISHHDGLFYMVTTLVRGGGNFYVTAKDPRGPWSDPIWLREVNGIDPSFFFDDDGKAYLVHNGPPPDNKPLYNGHRAIWLWQFDSAEGRVVGDGKIIVNGGTDLSKHPIWIEGPHIFRHNGHYYLIAAEGGTSTQHSQVVFRSDSVWGPYEPFDGNPILTQRHLPEGRPDEVTSTGHADFVQTQNGDWWAVFLGCRPYEESMTNIGRETFMLPVRWENDWPIVLSGEEAVGLVQQRPALPPQAVGPTPLTGTFTVTDRFDKPELDLTWNLLRTPQEPWYVLGADAGGLRIAPRSVDLTSRQNPSLIARRQQHADFIAMTTLVISDDTTDCDTGLVAIQNDRFYYFLGVRITDGAGTEIFVERGPGRDRNAEPTIVASAPLANMTGKVELRIAGEGRDYSFSYRPADGDWTTVLSDADGSILSTTVAGGFVGTYLGVFARVPGK